MVEVPDRIKRMLDGELRDYYLSLLEAIHVVGCYGSRDLIELAVVEEELKRRGYLVTGAGKLKKAR